MIGEVVKYTVGHEMNYYAVYTTKLAVDTAAARVILPIVLFTHVM